MIDYFETKNQKLKFLIIFFIIIIIHNKKIKIHVFSKNIIKILFSILPSILFGRSLPRHYNCNQNFVCLSYLDCSLFFFENYSKYYFINKRYLHPHIDFQNETVIFGDYNNTLSRDKNVNIWKISKNGLCSLYTYKSQIRHIHSITKFKSSYLISTGDSFKESHIDLLNINNELKKIKQIRCSWICYFENEEYLICSTDYPNKKNYIIKFLLQNELYKEVDRIEINSPSIFYNKTKDNIIFSTSEEGTKFVNFKNSIDIFSLNLIDFNIKKIDSFNVNLNNKIFGISYIFFKIKKNKVFNKRNNLLFKTQFNIFHIRKLFIYLLKIGFYATYNKVKSYYFFKNIDSITSDNHAFTNTQNIKLDNNMERGVAIVGCGNYMFSVICSIIRSQNIKIKYTSDINIYRAFEFAKYFKASSAHSNYIDLTNKKDIDIVFIATNHKYHADIACNFLKNEIPVHIEKPHVVNFDQKKLLDSYLNANKKVFLGFNRTKSSFYNLILEESSLQEGPFTMQWFIIGHHINEDHWYYHKEEGGRALGNLVHWVEFVFNFSYYFNYQSFDILPTLNSKSDFILSFLFEDGSSASINFTAKGESIEGVREYLNFQKSNCIIEMNNFETLKITNEHRIKTYKNRIKDQGHIANIKNSLKIIGNPNMDINFSYIKNLGNLTLMVKDCLDNNLCKKFIVEK